MDLRNFLDELKRRRVVRAAIAYAAVLFLVLQVADIVIPAVGLPESVMTGLVVVGALGFPLAMALAWALDMTPDGLERERPRTANAAEADRSSEASAGTAARRSGLGTALLLAVAAGAVGATTWWALSDDDVDTGPVAGAAADPSEIRSLAVLPLANLMGDSSQQHFVDGMHDILIGELARLDGLTVMGQRSVLRYRDSDLPLDAIASELGVDAVIEGSVFRQRDSVRVTARLIRTNPETDLWNESFEGRLPEAMTLQARVARAVADRIQVTLTRATAEHLARETEVDPRALDAYLLARDIWRSRDRDRMPRAIELFEEAVAIDPSFALGWAGVADGHLIAVAYSTVPRGPAIAAARAAIDRALALDPGLMEAHAANGALRLYALQDFRGAVQELSRVVEISPSYAQAHNWLADALAALGRREEALLHFERAIELDPLYALMWRDYSRGLMWTGRCEESIQAAGRALDIDPQHFYALQPMVRCLIRLGREEEAVEALLRGLDTAQLPHDSIRQSLRTALQRDDLEAALRGVYAGGPHAVVAARSAGAGEFDEAFGQISAALEAREALLHTLRADPAFEVLYDDPRWDDAMARLDSLGSDAR